MKNPRFFWLSLLLFMSFLVAPLRGQNASAAKADVGIILDYDTIEGKICKTAMSMALEDFYGNGNHTTMIVPHFRDSKSDVLAATSAAIDLLKNVEVMAILGPQKSIQADFVINIGNKVRVPIISPATSPAIAPKKSPYFIRSGWCSSSQIKAIAAIVKAFNWREVVFIYEDNNYGSGLIPFITQGLLTNNVIVSHQIAISPSATNDRILSELYKLKTMQTRVFVVHMLPSLASSFFKMAKEAEMMDEGYAWIIADVLTSLLENVDAKTIDAMQGVLGVKAYTPKTSELDDFTKRWSKRFHKENPDVERTEINVIGLWAYDSVTALAEGVERTGVTFPRFKKTVSGGNLTDLDEIGTSNQGPSLVSLMRDYRSKGLSGEFHVVEGELLASAFEIVNVIGKGENTVGFWTRKYGISKKKNADDDKDVVYSTNKDNLGAIVWPGQTSNEPKGWEMPTSGNKLRVGVPVKGGFSEFIKVERDAETNAVIATGFCIDVFEEVMRSMPYAVPFEYFPFDTPDGPGGYDDLVYEIFLQKFDAVVGDVTIVANRSKFVDFTFPYTESGVVTIVPVKGDDRKNAWIFLKPLTAGLWLTMGAFFVFTGFVVWALEHRVNDEFRGPPLKQVGVIFWFSFSTLVFAHKEKIVSNLTRFVVIVWVFVVLVLTSSYTANLTSMLTVEQLQPTINDINDLIRNGEYVGCQEGSFVAGFLNNMDFNKSMLRYYNSDEYDAALSNGSKNGGVAAIVDELPYIRLFLTKHCKKYTMIGPTYKTSGFGFAFPKGSPLVPDVSREILSLKENEKMVKISEKWFKDEQGCFRGDGTVAPSGRLAPDSFRGLFLIAGLSSTSALVIFLLFFLYENRDVLVSDGSIKQKVLELARVFDQKKVVAPLKESKTPVGTTISAASTPTICISYDHDGMFSQDEGFSTTEPGSPTHDATRG